MQIHLYEVGSMVALASEGLSISSTSVYVIEAQMPPVGTSLQYRIKSEAEGFSRVVVEHRLSALGTDAMPSPVPHYPPLPGEAD